MLKYMRHQLIEEMIRQNGSVLISTLARNIGVSEETIRRDLKELEHSGLLVRVHGGAHLTEKLERGVPQKVRETLLKDEKEKMSRIALNLIKEGSLIMLDSSTTCLTLARLIFEQGISTTVLTDSVSILELGINYETSNKVFFFGGFLNRKNLCCNSSYALEAVRRFVADLAFISCPSVDLKYGLTDNSSESADMRRVMLEQSRRKILLMDHTKFKSKSDFVIAPIKSCNMLITDKKPPSEQIAYFASIGLDLEYAE